MDPTGNEKAFAVLAFGLIDDEALYDPVTGLPGPALLVDRVVVALARARRLRRRVGIYVLCDACAPSDDDAARRVARLLRSEVRPDDTVARITDRTFVVACNDLQYETDVQRIAARSDPARRPRQPHRHWAGNALRRRPGAARTNRTLRDPAHPDRGLSTASGRLARSESRPARRRCGVA